MSYEFPREVLKIVVAQICQGFEFKAIEQSAHETLTDILAAYIEELGYNSHVVAEHACRTESNFYDVEYALQLMGSNVDSLLSFYNRVEEIPFPRGIPAFPMASQPPNVGILRDEVLPHPPHIPEWLPPFPDAKSYKSTSLFMERSDTSAKAVRSEKEKFRQIMENNLANLHQRSSSLMGNQDIVNYDQVRDVPRPGAEQRDINSFLRPRKDIDLDDSNMMMISNSNNGGGDNTENMNMNNNGVDQDSMDVDSTAMPVERGPQPTLISANEGLSKYIEKVSQASKLQIDAAAHRADTYSPPESPPASPRRGDLDADSILEIPVTADGLPTTDGFQLPARIKVPHSPGGGR